MRTNVLTGNLSFFSMKPCDLKNVTKEEIKAYFNNTFEIYESLFSSINDDSYYYLCPDRLRLPLIFYYGHTAAVYMNKLVLSGLAEPNERVNLEYEATFETGVDEMSWDDLEHYRMGGDYKWPTVEETKEYRLKLKTLVNKIIDRTPLELPIRWDSAWWALFMGFEHERIHLETSSVLIRQLPVHMVTKPITWKYFTLQQNKQIISNEMIRVEETDVRLGKEFDYPSYGWDNEYGRVDCRITAFEASKYKITNEEFLKFIKAKGYETSSYWTEEGWKWLQFRKLKHPSFWVCPNNCKSGCGSKISSHSHCQRSHFTESEVKQFEKFQSSSDQNFEINNTKTNESNDENSFRSEFPYKYRLMFDVVNMPYNWPVEIVYHEAKAFCKWKGEDYRVLTEAEHHAIRDNEVFDLDVSNDIIYQNAPVNHNLLYGSSTPVDFFEPNAKGFYDVFGNVWEWCEDHFNGLPGFKTTYLYDDFSTPCFDGRHNIIIGGSWIATGDEASKYARFMFRRHFLQHCGFRLARSTSLDGSKCNPQVRLVSDQIFVLGLGFTENHIMLDESKLIINKYKTENTQYLGYDSSKISLERQIEHEYGKESQKWFENFMLQLKSIISLRKNGSKMKLCVHFGSSTGRITFELAKTFENVIGVDFCGQFIETCFKLKEKGEIECKINSNEIIKILIEDKSRLDRVVFKQMTWVPNEIPKADFVLFSMIDRVMNQLSWLKRFKEIVDKHGLLAICLEKDSNWNSEIISKIIGKDFFMIEKINITENSLITFWKHNY